MSARKTHYNPDHMDARNILVMCGRSARVVEWTSGLYATTCQQCHREVKRRRLNPPKPAASPDLAEAIYKRLVQRPG